MYIFASRISSELVPFLEKYLSGRVHSVFESALNIETDSGEMITILAAQRDLQPMSIQIKLDDLYELNAGQDSVVSAKVGVVSIYGVNRSITIDTTDAAQICLEMRLECAKHGLSGEDYAKRLDVIASAIGGASELRESIAPILCGMFEGLPFTAPQNVYCVFLSERVRELYAALISHDAADYTHIGRRIAGCGVGLTPSSDDFICGVFAALYASAEVGALERITAQNICLELAKGAASETTAISASFIRNAAQGCFCESMLRLTRVFFSSKPIGLYDSAVRVCELGSTSGLDTLSGLWFGLAAARKMNSL